MFRSRRSTFQTYPAKCQRTLETNNRRDITIKRTRSSWSCKHFPWCFNQCFNWFTKTTQKSALQPIQLYFVNHIKPITANWLLLYKVVLFRARLFKENDASSSSRHIAAAEGRMISSTYHSFLVNFAMRVCYQRAWSDCHESRVMKYFIHFQHRDLQKILGVHILWPRFPNKDCGCFDHRLALSVPFTGVLLLFQQSASIPIADVSMLVGMQTGSRTDIVW